jgi:hypothetical protein
MPVIETALTRLLAIEHPIRLAPMGSAAGGHSCPAVDSPAKPAIRDFIGAGEDRLRDGQAERLGGAQIYCKLAVCYSNRGSLW